MLVLLLLLSSAFAAPKAGFNKSAFSYATDLIPSKGSGSAVKEVTDLCPWASEQTGSDADGGWFEDASMGQHTMLCMDGTTCDAKADGQGCCSCRRNRNGGVGRAKCPKAFPHMCGMVSKENNSTYYKCAAMCIQPFGGPRFCEDVNTVEDERCPEWTPTRPDIKCCEDDVAACNACKANMTYEKYCELHPADEGCPEICCMAVRADCEACKQEKTIEEVCQEAEGELSGCENIADLTVTSPYVGCDCSSVGDPHITGCRAEADQCVEKDFMEEGEFNLYTGMGMTVQTRQENAPFTQDQNLAWNTGLAFSGALFCDVTFEMDKGSWRANKKYNYPGDEHFRHCKLRTTGADGKAEEWEGVTQMYAGLAKYLTRCNMVTKLTYKPTNVNGKMLITLYDGSELRINNFCNTNTNLPGKHVGGLNVLLRLNPMGSFNLDTDEGLCAADGNGDTSSCKPLTCDNTLFKMYGRDKECQVDPPAPTPRPTPEPNCCQKDPSFRTQAQNYCTECRKNDSTYKSCIWDICETCDLETGETMVEACKEIVPPVPAVQPTPAPKPATPSPIPPMDTPAPTVPEKGFACNSFGDPHQYRLDGSYYDNFNSGEQNMLKWDDELRVDTRQEPCYYAPDTTGNKAVAMTGKMFCGYSLQYVHGSVKPFGKESMIALSQEMLLQTIPMHHNPMLIIVTPDGTVEKYDGSDAVRDATTLFPNRCSNVQVATGEKGLEANHWLQFNFKDKPKMKIKLGGYKHPAFGFGISIVDKGGNFPNDLSGVSGTCKDGGVHQAPQLEHCKWFHEETYNYDKALDSMVGAQGALANQGITEHDLSCDNPLVIEHIGRNDVMANCKPSLLAQAERECRKCGVNQTLFDNCLYDVCVSGNLQASTDMVGSCVELYEPVSVPDPTETPTAAPEITFWPSPSPSAPPSSPPTLSPTPLPSIKVHTVSPTFEPIPTEEPSAAPVPDPTAAPEFLCEDATTRKTCKGVDDQGRTCKYFTGAQKGCKGKTCESIQEETKSHPIKCMKIARKQKITGAVDLKGTKWGCMYNIETETCGLEVPSDVPCSAYMKYRSPAKRKKFCKKLGAIARGCKWMQREQDCAEPTDV